MESHIGKLTGHAAAAQGTYRRYCVGCHGVLGDGEGENAQWIDPKPRNFTLGIFKCRSTTTGTLPLDSDLYNTLGRGLDSSNMPSWNPLSSQERADLVAYVKHFSARFRHGKARNTDSEFRPGPRSPPTESKQGQAVFQKVECWKCHGPTGRGDGPSAATLTDDQNRPIQAITFTMEPVSNAARAMRTCTPSS